MSNEIANVPAVIDDKSKLAQIVERTSYRVHELVTRGDIQIPEYYNAPNALKYAHLMLHNSTVFRNGQNLKIYEACDAASIANALLKMVILGLNPAKNQIDFIAYGNKLEAQPSYFGEMAIVKKMYDIIDINTRIIYRKDDFNFHYDEAGRIKIDSHDSPISNWDDDEIEGAYTTIIFKDCLHTEIQTIKKIRKGWEESSKTYMKGGQVNPKSTHEKFPAEMVKRSMCRYALKPFLRSSLDYKQLLTSNAEINIEPQAKTYEIFQEADVSEPSIDYQAVNPEKTKEIFKENVEKEPENEPKTAEKPKKRGRKPKKSSENNDSKPENIEKIPPTKKKEREIDEIFEGI